MTKNLKVPKVLSGVSSRQESALPSGGNSRRYENGSIGVGANFGFNEPAKLYWSFGINKREFENMLKEVQKLFN